MLNILLIILKILGITLASVLGLVLILLIIVLFVPIRYKLRINKEEKDIKSLKADVSVSFLLKIFMFRILYDNEIKSRITIFGIDISKFKFGKGKDNKDKENFKSVNNKKRELNKKKSNKKISNNENSEEYNINKSTENSSVDTDNNMISKDDSDMTSVDYTIDWNIDDDIDEEDIINISNKVDSDRTDNEYYVENSNLPENDDIDDVKIMAESINAVIKTEFIEADEQENDSSEADSKETEDTNADNKSVSDKLNEFVDVIKKLYNKVINFINDSSGKADEIAKAIEERKNKINKYIQIFSDVRNKKAIAYVWKRLQYLLKKLSPRKTKGYIVFGFDDPATTGQVLVYLSILVSVLPKKLIISPDFDNEGIYCNTDIRGSITVASVVVTLWKVYFNKDVRRFWKMLK